MPVIKLKLDLDEELPMAQVVADEAAKEVAVHSLYDERFVKGAKRLGGKWFRDEKVWIFPLGAKDKVVALAKEVYGEKGVWEGPLPRKDELVIYRAAVHLYQGKVILGILFAEAEEPEHADLRFYYCYARRAGSLHFITYDRVSLGMPDERAIPHPERRLPVEMEMAIRWGRPYLSPPGPELPEGARKSLEERHPYLQRFLETGNVGECPHCGSPLIEDPGLFGLKLCVRCGRLNKKGGKA